MGRKPDFSVKEEEYVTRALANGKFTLQISKDMQRDHRAIKEIGTASHRARKKRVQPNSGKRYAKWHASKRPKKVHLSTNDIKRNELNGPRST